MTTMSVSCNATIPVESSITDRLVEVIEKCCALIIPKVSVNVALTLCDDMHIQEINHTYRKKDEVTDVLSFPMLASSCAGNMIYTPLDIDPETQEVMLGDVIISYERAQAQAHAFDHSIDRELSYLAVHSMLHLVGYDHIDADDKKIMRQKEEEILATLSISR